MQLVVCETPAQLRQAQELRYEVYCLEKGWIDPAPFTEGIETDEFDELAVHFLVLDDDGAPVGTSRLLVGSRQPLPAADFIDLSSHGVDASECVEVSRMAARRANRSQDLATFLGMTKVMWQWCVDNGVSRWMCVADVPVYLLMKRTGFPFLVIGDRVDYLGSVCVPSLLDVDLVGDLLMRRGFVEGEAVA